ncbi:putative vitellogenin receptor [Cylas formicarius]|uniref:putative vitellogenin receptor n=1 Tax=Cylas formicarius TaxID=197179 RepID=UPI002958BF08|nr:putative vitellogenin receptor [Cylas formicarius]
MLNIIFFLAGTVTTSGFLESLFYHTDLNPNNCSSNEFICANYKCVPKDARCNGFNNCEDFSDEEDCETYLCKEPTFFRCKNNLCIARTFLCDNTNDCGDYSDEESCKNFKIVHMNSTCHEGEWQCTDHLCIPKEWVCNQEADCLDGSDEGIGCLQNIDCDGFKCKNNVCIPNEWRCDKADDCGDNSDEVDCEHHFDPKKCTLEAGKFLCQDKKACVDLKHVCDGNKDCLDTSDESGMCSNSRQNCLTHHCSHTCVQLPTGPKCLCPSGYYNVNEKTCADINECEVYGICDHKCRNKPGSYECYCDHKYILQDDKKTCKAFGGEPTMVFSTKSQIRSYLLNSNLYFPVAINLKQAVGVHYDGFHVYWTDIFGEHESIVRTLEDGSNKELLVTSGLSVPEDLSVDYVTGNIYFTDMKKQHIGVCSNDGSHCTVLINSDIRKPRAIVLNVEDGTMFWTDWDKPAEIAFAYMDGTGHKAFLRDNIYWPNGLALDKPNERLYWCDAKKMTLESIRLDGTDRRIVLEGIAKHPFAIAVFEDRLFWSDWETHSIQICNKFTGKNHSTLIKDENEFIYGISIFHSALHERTENPCSLAFCSDICLLNGDGYTCACSEGKILGSDNHTCKEVQKKQMLVVGAKNLLFRIEHQTLGKHSMSALPSVVQHIGALTFDGQNNTLFISDLETRKIFALNLHTAKSKPLPIPGLGQIISMDYDPTGNNLYICDGERTTLEVVSLNTWARKVLVHDFEDEVPQSVAVVPKEGVMFVAIGNKLDRFAHIDRMFMDGTGRTHIVEKNLIGPISLHFDSKVERIFFADAGSGDIESTSIEGDDRHLFRSLYSIPSDVTTLNSDLFWVNKFSQQVYWSDRSSGEFVQKIKLEISGDIDQLHLSSVTPAVHIKSVCQKNNGNCSHLCLSSHKASVCACPSLMSLDKDNHTCIHRLECDADQFKCPLSRTCVAQKLRCDGKKDCVLGEDEEACDHQKLQCPVGYFGCDAETCIKAHQVCDHHYDCKDKSDEAHCELKTGKKCSPGHFMCGNGQCIADRFVCDGFNDCSDDSDEENCLSSTCSSTQFRCDSGTCIPKSWECDYEYDCVDFSDEHGECVSVACSSNMFTCGNGKCINKNLVCDFSDDCGDHSDERNCYRQVDYAADCKLNEFPCTSKTICLNNSARCNGTFECPGHEDEADCSNCDHESFECKNKKCIPIQFLCDGSDDCGDHSDENEELCKAVDSKLPSAVQAHVPCDDGFRCKTGACVNLELLCNNKQDCYDGSDENGLCSKSCDTLNNPCSQECIRTPAGPMCKCKSGYKLIGDGHTCTDIDECQQEPLVCSQICINKEGYFTCDCYDGYLLRQDRKTCKALGSPMTLIYAVDNQIRELSQKSNSLHILYSEDMPKIVGLDVAVKEHNIYFTTENSGTIQRINLKNKTRQYIDHIGLPQKIAYDWSTGHIYYYNTVPDSKSISVCSFQEMLCAKVIDIDIHRHVSDFVIDSVNKIIFYTLTSWFIFNWPSYAIYKANLDGSNIQEIVNNTEGYITGLAYNFNKMELYYVDQHLGQIWSTRYNGKQKKLLFSNLTRPTGLKFFEDNLYFSTSNGQMSKCQLFHSKTCNSFKTRANLFSLIQEGLQPDTVDPCQNHNCTFLCVAGSSHYQCLCENGKIIHTNEECVSKERTSSYIDKRPAVHSADFSGEDSQNPKTSGKTVSIVLLCLCMIAIAIALFVYAKKRHSGSFNLSVKFYNPKYQKEADENPILIPGQHEYTNPVLEGREVKSFAADSGNVHHFMDA